MVSPVVETRLVCGGSQDLGLRITVFLVRGRGRWPQVTAAWLANDDARAAQVAEGAIMIPALGSPLAHRTVVKRRHTPQSPRAEDYHKGLDWRSSKHAILLAPMRKTRLVMSDIETGIKLQDAVPQASSVNATE
ncbi:hypothetical protein VTN77DRAFT_6915 [Rasamsonia byssochlamydoides]|uniref:uncharacterized protein n=1 Tax=Rasamsonia byssochlamydoides TaxID=89139 RepID=UPI00374204B0